MDTFISTAIPFVNGAPHLGHALEYVQTDVLARHARASGRGVYFLTGTDEHAVKNVQAATRAGLPVAEFVAGNAARFRKLADTLDVTYDDFIRTSADHRHVPVVHEIWSRCHTAGDLYRAVYEGGYCPGCEEFRDEPCAEHDTRLETLREENWFFRLSRYASRIRTLIADGSLRIEPRERRNEVLGFLTGEVRDLSVSRPRARVGDWGIPVPGDPAQLVYVWFDALTNYVSAPGIDGWSAFAERTHVVGKGILRFHAVIWPAILLSAGLPLPDTLFVHDYVTARGRKIGKSLGNAIDPQELVDTYGADALRWWCAREVARVGETDFSEDRLRDVVNRDLANDVGNLVQRLAGLAGRGRPTVTAERLAIAGPLARFDLRAATGVICGAVADINRAIEIAEPWRLRGTDRDDVLRPLQSATGSVIDALAPFTPGLAAAARDRLRGRPGPPLVRRLCVES